MYRWGKEEVSPEKNKEGTGRDTEAESGGQLSSSLEMG